jgi:hypothetical protein
MGNISDISSYENDEFYNKSGGFFTISDFIATYEEHEQDFFNVLAYHQKDATSLDIEKSILRNAIMTVGFKDEDENGLAHELVKLSSCTHWIEKYKKEDLDKIKEFTSRQRGKWYFQPDQRCEVVNEFCDADPRIASDVPSWEDSVIARGGDPVQEKFNRLVLDCLNDKRIDKFKEEYQNKINMTFGNVLWTEVA